MASEPLTLLRGPYLQLGTTSNIVVRWRTAEPSDSKVAFGLTAASLPWAVADVAMTNEHILTLTNLAADTRYFYSIGSTEVVLADGTNCYFRTAPIAARPTRVWVLGDSGTANQGPYGAGQVRVRDAYYRYAGARHTDLWLMLGDNAYPSGTDQQYQDTVFDIYPDLLRTSVLWPTIGNHDALSLPTAYLRIFTLPQQGEAGGMASGTPRYYSFNYGHIHFVCLDSESSPNAPDSAMVAWLTEDLAANTNDWLIAFWHSPPYTFGTHDSDNPFDTDGHLVQMRENVVPVLEAHGVDLVLCGHSHNYERSYLLDGHYGYSASLEPTMIKDAGSGRPEDSGPYVKSGTGPAPRQGAVYVVAGSSGWVTPDLVPQKHPAMFLKLRELGSLVLDIHSNRLDAAFLRETGVVADWFTILKGAAPASFRFATIRILDGTVSAQWKSVAGQTYQLERCTDLRIRDWQAASPEITATGATTAWSGPQEFSPDQSFYRVVRLTP